VSRQVSPEEKSRSEIPRESSRCSESVEEETRLRVGERCSAKSLMRRSTERVAQSYLKDFHIMAEYGADFNRDFEISEISLDTITNGADQAQGRGGTLTEGLPSAPKGFHWGLFHGRLL